MLLKLDHRKPNRCKKIIRDEVGRQEGTIAQNEAEARFIG